MAPPGSGLSGFCTDTDQMRTHAATIAGKAESVGTAAEAAAHVADLNDAYGLICFQMGLPMILKMPQERCAQMVKEAQQELQRLEKSITAAAKRYDEQEQELLERLRKILEQLGGSGEFDGPSGDGGPVPMPTPVPPPGAPQPVPMPTPTQPPGTPQPVPMPTPDPPDGGGVPPYPPTPQPDPQPAPQPAPMPTPQPYPAPQPAPMPTPEPPDGGVPPAPMPQPAPQPYPQPYPQPAPMPNPTEPPQEV